jgi:hypothetical protein
MSKATFEVPSTSKSGSIIESYYARVMSAVPTKAVESPPSQVSALSLTNSPSGVADPATKLPLPSSIGVHLKQ